MAAGARIASTSRTVLVRLAGLSVVRFSGPVFWSDPVSVTNSPGCPDMDKLFNIRIKAALAGAHAANRKPKAATMFMRENFPDRIVMSDFNVTTVEICAASPPNMVYLKAVPVTSMRLVHPKSVSTALLAWLVCGIVTPALANDVIRYSHQRHRTNRISRIDADHSGDGSQESLEGCSHSKVEDFSGNTRIPILAVAEQCSLGHDFLESEAAGRPVWSFLLSWVPYSTPKQPGESPLSIPMGTLARAPPSA